MENNSTTHEILIFVSTTALERSPKYFFLCVVLNFFLFTSLKHNTWASDHENNCKYKRSEVKQHYMVRSCVRSTRSVIKIWEAQIHWQERLATQLPAIISSDHVFERERFIYKSGKTHIKQYSSNSKLENCSPRLTDPVVFWNTVFWNRSSESFWINRILCCTHGNWRWSSPRNK